MKVPKRVVTAKPSLERWVAVQIFKCNFSELRKNNLTILTVQLSNIVLKNSNVSQMLRFSCFLPFYDI